MMKSADRNRCLFSKERVFYVFLSPNVLALFDGS
jgi:hypothetical protein